MQALLRIVVAAGAATETVAQWGVWELSLNGPSEYAGGSVEQVENPFVDVNLEGTFWLESATTNITACGFYDGGGVYRLRFSPPVSGNWRYSTRSTTTPALNGKSGTIKVIAANASTGNHGPVISQGYELVYADGTPHFSTGTTCYQWASMPKAMQEHTLQTLQTGAGRAFNKIRMTVFPKWYEYNHQNPVEVGAAFQIVPGSVASNRSAWGCVGGDCPSLAGSFDLTRFNVSFWQNYESLIRQLDDAGIIADIIVFHPYDNGHWGFDCMGGHNQSTYNTTNDKFYLQYLGARLSAFKNVWWAMANEWNFCWCKALNATVDNGPTPIWDELFHALSAADPYKRQMSIHNGGLLYNHSQPWITHVSVQGRIDQTSGLRLQYGKPLIWDEVKYEGNITDSWGALSGVEEADRFWWGAGKGVYVGHSDTVLDYKLATFSDEQPLWWAKGGTLRGESPARISWFRTQHIDGDPSQERPPLVGPSGIPSILSNANSAFADSLTAADGSQMLLHFTRPGDWEISLPTQPPPAPTGICTSLEGVNCMNGDIRNGGVVASASACCALCRETEGCLAWTWNRGYNGDCWIKHSCATRSVDPQVVSGVGVPSPAPPPPPAALYHFDVYHLDFWGMRAVLLATVKGINKTTVPAGSVPFNVQIVRRQYVHLV